MTHSDANNPPAAPSNRPVGPLDRAERVRLGLVLLAVAAVTLPKLRNTFVWDDLYVIPRGTVIFDLANLPAVFANHTMFVASTPAGGGSAIDTYRPVTLATFFWDALISGREPWSYHLTNLLLHLGCVTLVYFLARRVLAPARRPWAWLAAGWFGLHPLLAEAHVWINGRSDPLCTLLGLSAILLWLRTRAATGWRRAAIGLGIAVLFLLGLLSKEVLVATLPALVFWPHAAGEHPSWRARAADLLPFAAAALAYLTLRVIVLHGMRTYGDPSQLPVAAARLPMLLADGLREWIAPSKLYVRSMAEDYLAWGVPGLVLASAVVLALSLAVVVRWRSTAVLRWAWLWFAGTLTPVAIIATVLWPGFGRYLYLPSVAVCIGLTDLIGSGVGRIRAQEIRRWAAPACVLYLAFLGGQLLVQTAIYRDEDHLYGEIIDQAPDRSHGYGWLGMTRFEEGRNREAADLLRVADRRAPQFPRYLLTLGYALARIGDRDGALDCAATGIARYESDGDFHALAARQLADIRPDLVKRHLDTCFDQVPAQAECAAVRQWLVTTHPGHDAYRALLRGTAPP